MSAKPKLPLLFKGGGRGVVAASALLAACATPPAAPLSDVFPASELGEACKGRDGWSDPAPPAHFPGNTWYVGTCGITALLVTSDAGHVLIDTGPADAAGSVAANIERLGFKLADVHWIVASHEHFDHIGGLAELQRRTGAKIAALPAAAKVLASGQPDPADPQFGMLDAIAPVRVNRILRDGETLEIGPLRLTAHATPAHSPGSTSWSWQSCDGETCLTMTYADSVSTPATKGYRFSDHPERIAAVRGGLAAVADLPCQVLITPHPSASGLFERLAAGKLVNAQACRAYAAAAMQHFEARLAEEAGG